MIIVAVQLLILKKKYSYPLVRYLIMWISNKSLYVCFLAGLLPSKASLTHLFNNLCKFNIIWLMISLPNSERQLDLTTNLILISYLKV